MLNKFIELAEVCLLLGGMLAVRLTYEEIYQQIYGRHPHDVFMEKLNADPVFGPAYRDALREDGNKPGWNTMAVLRAYGSRDGIG